MAFESMSYEDAKREFRRRYYTGLYAVCRGNLTQMAKRSGLQRLTVREALREVQIYQRAEADVLTGPPNDVRWGRSRRP
jgi:DNA-binding NtrC family response regulator